MKSIDTLSIVQKAMHLTGANIFKELATEELALIAARTSEVELEADETIEPTEALGGNLYVVIAGRVQELVDGKEWRVVGQGQAFGAMGMLGVVPDGESFRSLDRTHALVLTREDFEHILADYPEFALALIRNLARMILELSLASDEDARSDGTPSD